MNTTGKGLILLISGIIIAFFPGIISSLFYIIGVAVIIFNVINIIRSLTAGNPNVIPDIIGIIIGGAITSLPHFVQTIIPLTIGLILAFNGIDYAARALNNNGSRIVNAVLAAIDLVLGGTLLFHLVSAGNATRIIAGIVMIATGIYDFISDKKSGNGGNSEIIDVDSYSVREDNKFLR
ncbi:MAG: DUF308 domain-containing protein [Prevotella sp.]|nr:DUF308 domain-containing protein [Alistipes senegalensis]MCM1358443.1 DUF308 domain-containing protein [Prevotella sp.]